MICFNETALNAMLYTSRISTSLPLCSVLSINIYRAFLYTKWKIINVQQEKDGPKIEPCRTPRVIKNGSESDPSIQQRCDRLYK